MIEGMSLRRLQDAAPVIELPVPREIRRLLVSTAEVFIGLVAGVMLIFFMLGGVGLWPLPIAEVNVPGTARGWTAAHVGGILNGVMIATIAVLMRHLEMIGKAAFWVGWGLIITGWANTIFYWAGNMSSNRGLSVAATPYGPGDMAGAVAFLGGG
mgnify:CR=1 FL=1